jgi:hypothetical protein
METNEHKNQVNAPMFRANQRVRTRYESTIGISEFQRITIPKGSVGVVISDSKPFEWAISWHCWVRFECGPVAIDISILDHHLDLV